MRYQTKKLGDVLNYEQPTKYIVNSTDYSDSYETPVLTAGKTFVKGYTNEEENIFPADKLPVIIFDDFTTASQLVDFKFKVKSSAMKILHAKKGEADIKYIFYIMQTIKHNHVTHKRYWISEYSKIEIPLPPLSEQKKIVAKLERLLEKVNEAKKLRAEAQEATSRLLPAELHKIFEEGKKKYEPETLGNVAGLVRGPFGGSLRKDMFVDDGYAVYEQGNVIKNNTVNFRYYISDKKFNEMRRFEVSSGDILMSCSGTIGKFTVIPTKFKKGIINQALLKITPGGNTNVDYLRYALDDYLKQSTTHIKGGAIKNITSVKELKSFEIPFPSLLEQKKIVERLDGLSERTKRLQDYQESTSDDLLALEQSILSKAFSGEFV